MPTDNLDELRQILPTEQRSMAARLGDVLYWFANGLVGVWGLPMVVAWVNGNAAADGQLLIGILFIPVALIWVFCRAAKYVLSGG